MTSLFRATERYCAQFDLKKLSSLKICCLSFGVAMGTLIPKEQRKTAFYATMAMFLATYIPIMADFLGSMISDEEAMYDEDYDYYF